MGMSGQIYYGSLEISTDGGPGVHCLPTLGCAAEETTSIKLSDGCPLYAMAHGGKFITKLVIEERG